jgi:hypothetical protein
LAAEIVRKSCALQRAMIQLAFCIPQGVSLGSGLRTSSLVLRILN